MGACTEKKGREKGRTGAGAVEREGRSGTGGHRVASGLSEFVGIEYRQPSSFASRRGDQDRTSQTVFIKIKGINPLKGIKKCHSSNLRMIMMHYD